MNAWLNSFRPEDAGKLYKGEHFALMGGNGSGKSTLLYLLAGAYKPLMGRIKTEGKITLLPQNRPS